MSREWDAKRRECREKKSQEKEKPKDKDGKRKRHQWKAAEKTSVSRDSDDIRKNLSGEKSVSSLWPQGAVDKKGCQDSEMSGASRIKRKWQHQTRMLRVERNVKKKVSRADAVKRCAGPAIRRR